MNCLNRYFLHIKVKTNVMPNSISVNLYKCILLGNWCDVLYCALLLRARFLLRCQ
jgi:hypothetical protein